MKSTKFLFLLFIPFIFLSCFEDDDDNESTTDELDQVKANVKLFSMRQTEYVERSVKKAYQKEINEYITQLQNNWREFSNRY